MMSYSKKDEDGDSAIFKVDRTSVFQEGIPIPIPTSSRYTHLINLSSPSIQLFTDFSTKMPPSSNKDDISLIQWGEVPRGGSYLPVFRHNEALPAQRRKFKADGIFSY